MQDRIIPFPSPGTVSSDEISLMPDMPDTDALCGVHHKLECMSDCNPMHEYRSRLQRSLEELARSEERYRTLASVSSTIVWIANPDGTITRNCPSWQAYSGQSHHQEVGWGWTEAMHPDDCDRVIADWQRAIPLKQAHFTECRLRRKDGEFRHFCVRAVPIIETDGSLREWVGTCTDITEQKQAEAASRDSEEKFRQLAENISDVFWVTSTDFQQIIYISPAYEKIWGQPASGLFTNPHQWLEAILPEDRARVMAEFAPVLNNLNCASTEYRIRRPDGQIRWIHDRGFQVRDAAGNFIRIAGIASDITEKKNADLALQKSEERLRRYFDLGLIGISIGSPDKAFLDANEELCRITGYSREELLQKTWLELTHPDDQNSSAETHDKILAGQLDGYTFEKRYIRKDGDIIHVAVSVKCARNSDGAVEYFVALIKDITARRKAEAQLKETQADLLLASRRAGMADVATNVLHNVRNILNSVNITSSCLAEGASKSKAGDLGRLAALLQEHQHDLAGFFTSDPRARQIPGYLNLLANHLAREQAEALKSLEQLRKHIDHINGIVSLQQAFAKSPDLADVANIPLLLDDALGMISGGRGRGEIEIAREIQPMPPVQLQKHKVLQILVNLLRNAREACVASSSAKKKIGIRASIENSLICIAISDNGVGIPAENLPRIFQHGFTTKLDGHGFGLHGSATCAHEMGGTLTVESGGSGRGATFKLCIPLEQALPPESEPITDCPA